MYRTSTYYKPAETDIQHCIHYITNIPHSVLTGDVHAHSTPWHSYTDDHRGQLIVYVINNSDHITLNTNTPTRVPNTTLQQTSSPDITTVSNTLYNRTSWTTQHALSSDHLPIITTINIRHDNTITKLTDFHQLQESWLDTIHGSALLLRPPYPPTYTLPTYCLQTAYWWQTSTTYHRARCISTSGSQRDLRTNILFACKVTPAIWLNLSDSRSILIIHFGLLLKERTLDSIGHDLWKRYNVICLLWMICYISLLTNIFKQWILIGA